MTGVILYVVSICFELFSSVEKAEDHNDNATTYDDNNCTEGESSNSNNGKVRFLNMVG